VGLDVHDQVTANRRRSWLLMASFVALVVTVGVAVGLLLGGGALPVAVALVVATAGVAGAWWRSDAIALAVSHARPADPVAHARLHNLVEGLCIAGGLPKPRVYVIEDAAPNAFATGRDPRHAAVVVTTGLLARLDRVELEGVLAHELSHIRSNDILVSTLAVTLVGVVTLLADVALRFLWWGGPRHRDDRREGGGGPQVVVAVLGFVLLPVAPLVARIMRAAVSRQREALADVAGVALTRYPPGLISALEKLRDDTTVVHSASRATAHLWIESPIDRSGGSRQAWLNRQFDTHPPLSERIEALREL
jgi:heat shock protein HtpX